MTLMSLSASYPVSWYQACIGDLAHIRQVACIKTSGLDPSACTRNLTSIWAQACISSFMVTTYIATALLAWTLLALLLLLMIMIITTNKTLGQSKSCLRVPCRWKTHKKPTWPWPLSMIFNMLLEVVKVHISAKFHQTKCSGSWVIVLTNFLAPSRSGQKSENPLLWP